MELRDIATSLEIDAVVLWVSDTRQVQDVIHSCTLYILHFQASLSRACCIRVSCVLGTFPASTQKERFLLDQKMTRSRW